MNIHRYEFLGHGGKSQSFQHVTQHSEMLNFCLFYCNTWVIFNLFFSKALLWYGKGLFATQTSNSRPEAKSTLKIEQKMFYL